MNKNELARIRHKYYINLKKPDHLLILVKNKSICGRISTANIYTDNYWYLLDKLQNQNIFIDRKLAGNFLCGSCLRIFKQKNEKQKE
jgi:hypothetical protein